MTSAQFPGPMGWGGQAHEARTPRHTGPRALHQLKDPAPANLATVPGRSSLCHRAVFFICAPCHDPKVGHKTVATAPSGTARTRYCGPFGMAPTA
jgi:hypothetical protein